MYGSQTSIKLLLQKLAFVFAKAAFIRPFDLVRKPFSSCEIYTSNGCLKVHVVSFPKKLARNEVSSNHLLSTLILVILELWPVQCFKALPDYPGLQARSANFNFFVKWNNIREPLVTSTLSSWLHRKLISLSTSEPKISIRCLASPRGLDKGISLDHIVTLDNWASTSTFRDYYQCSQMAMVDLLRRCFPVPMTMN